MVIEGISWPHHHTMYVVARGVELTNSKLAFHCFYQFRFRGRQGVVEQIMRPLKFICKHSREWSYFLLSRKRVHVSKIIIIVMFLFIHRNSVLHQHYVVWLNFLFVSYVLVKLQDSNNVIENKIANHYKKNNIYMYGHQLFVFTLGNIRHPNQQQRCLLIN